MTSFKMMLTLSNLLLPLFAVSTATLLPYSTAQPPPPPPPQPPPPPDGYGYKLESVSHRDGEISAKLRLIRESPVYGPDVHNLNFQASYVTKDRLRIRISDADRRRWEVPDQIIPRSTPQSVPVTFAPVTFAGGSSDLAVSLRTTTTPFSFSVFRRSTGDIIFDTQLAGDPAGGIVFKDQYLRISSSLPGDGSSSLYGLGEHTKKTFRLVPNDTFTLWNADIASANLDLNLYGSHPFYMDVRSPGGAAHGVLLLNSNGMDIYYGGSSIVYRAIGGILDLYFFAGPSPLAVVDQYTQFVGRPAPMPYWSFGFHQCRYGYKNVSELEGVVAGYRKARIPLEVMWTDIDYMDGYKVFTLDPVNFPPKRMREFVGRLHAAGQRYVVIVDPGISVNDTYGTFNRGMEAGIFLKNASGEYYHGVVWPGDVYFPDFFHPAAGEFWAGEIARFRRELLPVDGLWIDMNEISNFVNPPPANHLDDPPYQIDNSGDRRPISNKTVPASAVHYGNLTEDDVHNLFGLLESRATHDALARSTGKRPFVLTRSTFVGSGRFAAHWTGDNEASWNDLAYSIPVVLSFGLFGVPMVGADICGFNLNTTEELCRRWIQLGAFYPFARNHYGIDSIRHELYIWPSVAEAARKSLGLRYRLLPHLYTLMYEAHLTGAPIARPLFFSFPEDPRALAVDTQFLIGKGILVSPVLAPAATTVEAYFPEGTWFNLFNYSSIVVAGGGGADVTLDAPPEEINVHVRAGTVLPMQAAALTTRKAQRSGFQLLVALDGAGAASGELFFDDDESLEMGGGGNRWSFFRFVADGLKLRSEVVNGGVYASDQKLVIEKVVFLGVKRKGSSAMNVAVNGLEVGGGRARAQFKEGVTGFGIAKVARLSLPIGKEFELKLSFSD